jgi:hypothetical protein
MTGNHGYSAPRPLLAKLLAALLLASAGLLSAVAQEPATAAAGSAALRARFTALQEQLSSSVFKRPLVLESTQTSGDLKGDVYAVVEYPFATVGQALQGTGHWCDILILHLNVKHCKPAGTPGADVLSVSVGRKFDQPLSDAYRVDFAYRVAASSADYLLVQLNADTGPMSTRNYRIVLEAVPLDSQRSFVHMSYSYAYGFAARVAIQGYLATLGAGKVGFSVVERRPDGQVVYVDNVRGVVERNTMRYYLAIEAYLGAYAAPPAEQLEKRLRDWFAATERYALQLHEMDQAEYLGMKRKEVARQLAPAPAALPQAN